LQAHGEQIPQNEKLVHVEELTLGVPDATPAAVERP
jgi:hypothetical protein